MKINKEVIKRLEPCDDRYDNYLKFYGDKEFTKAQFMGLKNIAHRDKLWVACRLMTKEQCVKAMIEHAESVLHIFEGEYPDDKRPRLAIEASKKREDVEHVAWTNSALSAAYMAHSDGHFEASYAAACASNAQIFGSGNYFTPDITENNYGYVFAAINHCNTPELHRLMYEKLVRKFFLKHWKG